MEKAIITFANGETLIIEEDDVFELINPIKHSGKLYSRIEAPPFKIWSEKDYENFGDYGLIIAITTMCLNSSFFARINDLTVFYHSSAVVSIKKI